MLSPLRAATRHSEPAAGVVFRRECSLHRLGQAAGQGEAEAGAGWGALAALPAEGGEDPVPVGRGNAGPLVDDAQFPRSPGALAVTVAGKSAGEYRIALDSRFASTRSSRAGSATVSGVAAGIITRICTVGGLRLASV